MATIFSCIAKEAALANSIKVQRYHGGLSNTLITDLKASDFGTIGNAVYLCPIPWYARIEDISIVFDGAAKYETTNPEISLSVRSMKDKGAQNISDLTNLEYTQIFGTKNDYATAKGKKTLAGIALTNDDNTTEIVIAKGINPFFVDDTEETPVNYRCSWELPFLMRQLTLAECYSYKKEINDERQTKDITVFSDNAKGLAAKEQFGMLTAICTTAGVGTPADANALISVTYVDPAPSSIAQGTITVNRD